MKFGQLIGYNKRNTFLQNKCRKCNRETNSRPLFVFLKSFILGKSKWSAALFYYIPIAFNLAHNKKQTVLKLRLLIQKYAQF